ncbi:MAG TPA: YrhK family protein [Guyparkeria sp.]|nr:YrhK family protein [Guyparkeria sp.]
MRDDPSLTLSLGREALVIHNRHEAAVLVNDFLIGLWFTLGSVAFLLPAYKELGAWVFLVASIQHLVRPSIRLARNVHVQ